MKDHYSLIASWYSSLAKLVFGTKLKESKLIFACDLQGKKVLFIGGGDGSDYVEIQEELQGEFWEMSEAMLAKAQKNLENSKLSFHLGNFKSSEKFDLIFLPFVLDTMPDDELEGFLLLIKKNLPSDGKVVMSDFFEPVGFSQKFLHQLMISFFRIATDHPRKDVPDYGLAFKNAGFKLSQEEKLLNGWVRAQVWKLY